jgi:hypothetical protein
MQGLHSAFRPVPVPVLAAVAVGFCSSLLFPFEDPAVLQPLEPPQEFVRKRRTVVLSAKARGRPSFAHLLCALTLVSARVPFS